MISVIPAAWVRPEVLVITPLPRLSALAGGPCGVTPLPTAQGKVGGGRLSPPSRGLIGGQIGPRPRYHWGARAPVDLGWRAWRGRPEECALGWPARSWLLVGTGRGSLDRSLAWPCWVRFLALRTLSFTALVPGFMLCKVYIAAVGALLEVLNGSEVEH
ncbi:hypothetical protein NDU88_004563 [Pleurodeles waltl]|uniref:Uncharacterized protein n=1 Tax=Pleurodeles waltl TaxID=8319 RepID=A0AAV7TRL5_PLEWA|nr:hypothetical protein NDU88_004563 [Pleurodeles waltl]